MVCQAVRKGDIAIWRTLNGIAKRRVRPLVLGDGKILTDAALISKQLSIFHERSMIENTSIPPGGFEPVVWAKDFILKEDPDGDFVLNISNDLVVANVKKLKICTGPDNILPILVKALFGCKETVKPLAYLIRAVAKTRVFPSKGKIARQIFVWKGKGEKDSLEDCRAITVAGVVLNYVELI